MADEKKNSKVSLKLSKETISSVIYTLNVPNFFILPEYDGTEVESPSFEFANRTWRLHFTSNTDEIRNCRSFEVYLSKINSKNAEIAIICSVTILDADGEKYDNGSKAVHYSSDSVEHIRAFDNKKPSYDRHDFLTLSIHLISDKSFKVSSDQVPLTTDKGFRFCPNIADETKDSKVSLKSSKNSSVSKVICTLNVPNFFILPEYDGTEFEVESPSFEYANTTWRFKFFPDTDKTTDYRSFKVYLFRIFSEYAEISIVCSIALLDADDEKYDNGCNAIHFWDADDIEGYIYSFDNKKPSYDRRGFLTLIIHLFSDKSFKVASNQVPLTTDKDIDVLSQDFKKLFLTGKNHDLTLRAADKEFRVHQDILMARSQVFQAMLTHDMTEKNEGVIDVPDCDPQAMEQFLFYVYSGKVETLNQENALGLYYAADKYNMTLLKGQCTEYIKKSLTPSIICGVIQLALNHSDNDLLECATEYFLDHTREIFPTLEWMSFMKTNSIAANELLIKASEKWNSAN